MTWIWAGRSHGREADTAVGTPVPAPACTPEQVQEALQEGLAWLRFAPPLEAHFLVTKARERLMLAMVTGIAVVLLFAITLLADLHMTPDVMELALWLRLGLFPAVVLGGLQLMRRWQRPLLNEWLVAGAGVLAIAIQLAVLHHSRAPWALSSVLVFNLIVVCACTMARFWPAVAMALTALAVHCHAVYTVHDPSGGALPTWSTLLLAANVVFTLYGNHRIEKGERLAYLLGLQEAQLDAELHAAHDHIQRLATTDALTGLANRRHLDAHAAASLARALAERKPLSMAIIDIDEFKRYNDRYGHQAGDLCLVDVARALNQQLRRTGDLLARWGGEEFVVLMPDADAAVAQQVAERMRLAVQALALPHAGALAHAVVTVSVGVATLVPDRHTRLHALSSQADRALYEAKARGRNQVQVAPPEPSRPAPTLPTLAASPTVATTAARAPSGSPHAEQGAPTEAGAGTHPEQRLSPTIGTAPTWREALFSLMRLFSPTAWQKGDLAFERGREQRFQTSVREARLAHFALSGLFALPVLNLFLMADRVLVPDIFDQALLARLGIITPVGIVLLVLGHWGRQWCLRQSTALIEFIMSMTGVATTLGLWALFARSNAEMAYLWPGGLLPVLIYGNLVQRFRFKHALVFSVLTSGVGVAALWSSYRGVPLHAATAWPQGLLVTLCAVYTLVMNHRMERLERRRYLTTERDASLREALNASQARLEELSRQDSLTSLPNRRHADHTLQTHWQALVGPEASLGLLLLDVDHFKAYNDRYGHPAGDQCLRHVAGVMQRHLQAQAWEGETPTLARWGGEEFIVLLPGHDAAQAMQVARGLQQAVHAATLRHEAAPEHGCVTVSIGVSACRPCDPSWSPDGLIAQADAALYRAKALGRNRCACAEAPDRSPPLTLVRS